MNVFSLNSMNFGPMNSTVRIACPLLNLGCDVYLFVYSCLSLLICVIIGYDKDTHPPVIFVPTSSHSSTATMKGSVLSI